MLITFVEAALVDQEATRAAQEHLATVLQHQAVLPLRPLRLRHQALAVPLQLVLEIQALSLRAAAAAAIVVAVAAAVAAARVLLCWPQTSRLLATVPEVPMQRQANRTPLRMFASATCWNLADFE